MIVEVLIRSLKMNIASIIASSIIGVLLIEILNVLLFNSSGILIFSRILYQNISRRKE